MPSCQVKTIFNWDSSETTLDKLMKVKRTLIGHDVTFGWGPTVRRCLALYEIIVLNSDSFKAWPLPTTWKFIMSKKPISDNICHRNYYTVYIKSVTNKERKK